MSFATFDSTRAYRVHISHSMPTSPAPATAQDHDVNRPEALRANQIAMKLLGKRPPEWQRAERILHKSMRMCPTEEGKQMLLKVLEIRKAEKERKARGDPPPDIDASSDTSGSGSSSVSSSASSNRVALGNPGAKGLRAVMMGGSFIGSSAVWLRNLWPIATVLAPLGSMACVLWTVFTCYYMWRTGSNIRDPRVIFPAISELGASMPEHRVYQVGFAVTGVLLALHIHLFSQIVIPQLLEYGNSEMQQHADNCVWYGYVAAAGVIAQGVFTLEMALSAQSCVHWAGAIMFMNGAMNHAQESRSLYESALQYADHVPILTNRMLTSTIAVRRFIVDYSTVFMFLPIILTQLFFASQGKANAPSPRVDVPDGATPAQRAALEKEAQEMQSQMPDPKTMNMMGAMQWAIILQFAVYFCTYAVDLYLCQSIEVENSRD